jgi:hypothetical protein
MMGMSTPIAVSPGDVFEVRNTRAAGTFDVAVEYQVNGGGWTYFASGNGGNILALKDKDNIYQFTAAGLVE